MRLDRALVERKLASSRSQANDMIKRKVVELNNKIVQKPNQSTSVNDKISIIENDQYVSRAGRKLASIATQFDLDFKDKTVLDVGSSTGGFTDYSLQHGAGKVVAVDVGTQQLHAKLRGDKRVELHEKTDIRKYQNSNNLEFDFILIDVSFISILDILPAVYGFSSEKTRIVAMVKPQFETGKKHKGVVKNNTIRRNVLSEVEQEFAPKFIVMAKKDSELSGAKGNIERFYLLKKSK
ncbi:TlyA family RNA methyltransferase [Candidatus Saccharibacteria bacterium]|nr:TlyA family RNA methyltransferase [Candidatus Saccharibacteria bacterium]